MQPVLCQLILYCMACTFLPLKIEHLFWCEFFSTCIPVSWQKPDIQIQIIPVAFRTLFFLLLPFSFLFSEFSSISCFGVCFISQFQFSFIYGDIAYQSLFSPTHVDTIYGENKAIVWQFPLNLYNRIIWYYWANRKQTLFINSSQSMDSMLTKTFYT